MSPEAFTDWLASKTLVGGAGPVPSQIALVGEAPGENEEAYGRPFVGEAGHELVRMLKEAGLDFKSCYATNVFKVRPPDTDRSNNDIQSFFVGRSSADHCTSLPPNGAGKFVRKQLEPHVRSLVNELVGVEAKLVIAFGNTALWGLLGRTGISKFVGTVHAPTAERPFTVIPTYHPAAVLRQYSFRTTAIANLKKAAGVARSLGSGKTIPAVGQAQSASPFQVTINPSIEQVERFALVAAKAPEVAIDIETKHGQIRTVGFAIEPTKAFVIPFWEPPRGSYWPTLAGELRAWNAVRRICGSPAVKIGHNFLYDLQYLWRVYGIPVNGPIEDTMLWSHAAEPELPRSLGHLAATYLSIPEWKTMRFKSEKEEE